MSFKSLFVELISSIIPGYIASVLLFWLETKGWGSQFQGLSLDSNIMVLTKQIKEPKASEGTSYTESGYKSTPSYFKNKDLNF